MDRMKTTIIHWSLAITNSLQAGMWGISSLISHPETPDSVLRKELPHPLTCVVLALLLESFFFSISMQGHPWGQQWLVSPMESFTLLIIFAVFLGREWGRNCILKYRQLQTFPLAKDGSNNISHPTSSSYKMSKLFLHKSTVYVSCPWNLQLLAASTRVWQNGTKWLPMQGHKRWGSLYPPVWDAFS